MWSVYIRLRNVVEFPYAERFALNCPLLAKNFHNLLDMREGKLTKK